MQVCLTSKLLKIFLPPARFWKTAGGIVLGSIAISAISAVSAVSADVSPYISVAIKASFFETLHVQYMQKQYY